VTWRVTKCHMGEWVQIKCHVTLSYVHLYSEIKLILIVTNYHINIIFSTTFYFHHFRIKIVHAEFNFWDISHQKFLGAFNCALKMPEYVTILKPYLRHLTWLKKSFFSPRALTYYYFVSVKTKIPHLHK